MPLCSGLVVRADSCMKRRAQSVGVRQDDTVSNGLFPLRSTLEASIAQIQALVNTLLSLLPNPMGFGEAQSRDSSCRGEPNSRNQICCIISHIISIITVNVWRSVTVPMRDWMEQPVPALDRSDYLWYNTVQALVRNIEKEAS